MGEGLLKRFYTMGFGRQIKFDNFCFCYSNGIKFSTIWVWDENKQIKNDTVEVSYREMRRLYKNVRTINIFLQNSEADFLCC